MSLYRSKKSPFWQFDFQIERLRFYGSTNATDKREAKTFEEGEKQRARELIDATSKSGRGPLTVGAAIDRWWDEHGRHLRDHHLEAELAWLGAQLGRGTFLHDITDDTVSRLVRERRKDVVRAGRDENGIQLWRPVTARTVNKTVISMLRRIMRRARDNWDAAILREPVWKKHLLKETRRPVREITPAEEEILDAVETADWAILRRFAIIMGLRQREILLRWPQVDFDQGVIRIIGKGGIPAVLPLSREAYAILWAQRGRHPEFVFTFTAQRTRPCPRTKDPKTGKPFVFVKGQRYPITAYGIRSNKRRWKNNGQIEARWHDTRHTTGMRTLRATGNLKVVQKLLRHSDVAITAKFYTDALVDDIRDALETTAKSRKKSRTGAANANKLLK